MPRGYERMRDAFRREGLSMKDAKTKAAKIWNSQHPGNPVTRRHRSSYTRAVAGRRQRAR
jgi:hypothetical protein